MPHKGISRARSRSLEIGTDPSGFNDEVQYCPACGHPLTAQYAHSHYVEQPLAIKDMASSHPQKLNPYKVEE